MAAARIDLCEVSPMTQRSASSRFDLPQPFGPTTPVSPRSMTRSVGSTNDLKPSRRRRAIFIKSHPNVRCWIAAEPQRVGLGRAPCDETQ